MITRGGWGALAGTVVLAVAGLLLGLTELWVLAGAGASILALAALQVAQREVPVGARRVVRPTRVHVGSPARVELEVAARRERSSPVLTLVDPIGDRTGARLRLAPLAPGAATRASYRLPTRQRGEVPVGPLTVERVDPLGLVRRRWEVADRVRLVVLPHVDTIPPLPRPPGSEPLSGQEGRPGAGRAGDEFHSLRPYVVGDDLRRVHWPMSARRDELVVRVDDEPHQGRLTVVLDLARDRSDSESFERMVSAAASISAAHWRAGDLVRLLCSNGRDTGWVTGQAAFDGLLEELAVTDRGPATDMAQVLAHMGDGSDTVAAITGDLPDTAVAALPGWRARGGPAALTVVRFARRGGGTGAARPGSRLAGMTVIDVAAGQPFAPTWTHAVSGRRRGRRPAGAMTS